MVDPAIQAALENVMKPAKNGRKLSHIFTKNAFYMGALVVLLLLGLIITKFYHLETFAQPEHTVLAEENMAQIIVMVAQHTDEIPVDVWADVERMTGKKVKDLNSEEQIEAIRLLLGRLETTPEPILSAW